MHRERLVCELIAGLYDAAWLPSAWGPWLTRVGDAIGGGALVLHLESPTISRPGWIETMVGLGPVLQSYAAHFVTVDPHVPAMGLRPVGEVGTGERLGLDPRSLERTEFYNDFMRPNGMRASSIGAILGTRGNRLESSIGSFALGRRSHGDEALDLMRAICPHLQRAVRIAREVRATRLERDALVDVLDQLPQGVVVVDRRARVMRMNRIASEMIARNDGLVVERGTLRASRAADTRALHALIACPDARAPGRAGSVDGVLVAVRPSRARPFEMLVAPLGRLAGDELGAPDHAIVFISDPDAVAPMPADVLRALYGLTPAEASLAVLIGRGARLQDAADELGVTIHTVRTQLNTVLAKTGARRQAELVRLLLLGLGALDAARASDETPRPA